MTATAATPEFASLREKIAWEKEQRLARYARFGEILREAHAAGCKAHDEAVPTTMVVGSPTHPLGNDIDPTKPIYVESEGPCGFAWVRINPGSSSFARWLVKEGHGAASYPKGVAIWVRTQGQSYERKSAYAAAMAEVLNAAPELGGLRIYAGGRLD